MSIMDSFGTPITNRLTSYVENISFDSTLINDQGDIFHCGKCKLNFHSFFEFISHKREDASHLSERLPNIAENEIHISDDRNNQIWIWNPPKCNDILTPPSIENNLNSCENIEVQREQINFTASEIDNYGISVKNSSENTLQHSIPSDIATKKTEKSLLTCSVCHRQFKKQFSFFHHLKTHSGEKPFQCTICGRTFPQKSNAKKHILSHKVWPDGLGNTLPEKAVGSDLGYSCKFCNIVLPSYYKLKVHLKEHGHQKVFKCIQKKCTAMFIDVDMLISHIKTDHQSVEYHCHICSVILTSLEEMSSHQQDHVISDMKSKHAIKYTCIYCHSTFKKYTHLTYHLATTNHVNTCSHCEKSFVTEKALRRHLSLHSEDKTFKCDICSMSFRQKHYLCSHMLTHSKEKSFICSICNSRFSRKDLLMRHIKIHQPNKKKYCPFRLVGCTMEFTRTDKLNLHIKTHTKRLENRKKSSNSNNNNSVVHVKKQSSEIF